MMTMTLHLWCEAQEGKDSQWQPPLAGCHHLAFHSHYDDDGDDSDDGDDDGDDGNDDDDDGDVYGGDGDSDNDDKSFISNFVARKLRFLINGLGGHTW